MTTKTKDKKPDSLKIMEKAYKAWQKKIKKGGKK